MLLANGDGTSFWDLFLLLAIFLPLMFLWAFGLVDVFLRKDLSGIAKVVWAILILWLPLIGILVYFLTRPDDPTMMSWSDDGGEASARARIAMPAATSSPRPKKIAPRPVPEAIRTDIWLASRSRAHTWLLPSALLGGRRATLPTSELLPPRCGSIVPRPPGSPSGRSLK